ncbi:CWC16 protein [Penicillium bovifimosum]|uniref:Splicing factor YJU2 n=1 Tax=Penicillium bovifimosum TaxID=126998 RepID=A0A9W9HFW2_9EURO|nr:CWC16 protein [Penicillium bovifimosum]KAJ5146466.1 CWC16 protein [Penicillium bovifimosum]
MAERKVLSKYYPPDFDPNAITRKKPSGDRRAKPQPVRLMTPFSMKCAHCGEFIPKGRKFNASKEITDEHYMKVKIIRFHIHCSRCRGEITFKTDPKNKDYECERGAKRNFEVWRDPANERYHETEEQTLDRLEQEQLELEEKVEKDKMADLEEKMLDSKREMQIADALDEIRTRNARIERNEARGEDAALATVAQKKLDEAAAAEAAKQAWIEEGVEEARRNFNDIQRRHREEELDKALKQAEEEEKAAKAEQLKAWDKKSVLADLAARRAKRGEDRAKLLGLKKR